MTTALLLGAAFAGVLYAAMLPRRFRLYLTAILSFVQLPDFPGVPAFVAWVLFMSVLAVPEVIEAVSRGRRAPWPVWVLVAMAGSSLLWSLFSPERDEGIQATARILVIILLILLLLGGKNDRQQVMNGILFWSSPLLVLQSAVTAVFRLSPSIEATYFGSSIGRLFIGSSGLDNLYTTARNNVLDPGKAGGLLFVNANVDSMYLGVGTFAMLFLWLRTRSKWALLAGVLTYAGVFFTGSKTGLSLALLLPIAWVLIAFFGRRENRPWAAPLTVIGFLGAVILPTVLSEYSSNFVNASDLTLSTRFLLWSIAGALFVGSPLLGLGYGGWVDTVTPIVGVSYPPHNLIIAAWANGGLPQAGLLVGLMTTLIVIHFRRIMRIGPLAGRLTISASACALVWIFAHGMADNTAFYGDNHTIVFFSIFVVALILGKPSATATEQFPKQSEALAIRR